jgi:hypothetical protein
MEKVYFFVLMMLFLPFTGCVDDDDGDTAPDYKDMQVCYEVSGSGGNNYGYDYSYDYRKGNGDEGDTSGSKGGPMCIIFEDMDFLNGDMKDTSNCGDCTAEIEIKIDNGDGWDTCDEASTSGSGTIRASCSYKD